MFLFAKAGALAYVGVTDLIGASIYGASGGGNIPFLIIMVLWISGFASAACDNVLVVATLVPVLQYLTEQLGSNVLWWALLFGGCYGGNMTMVGSTANIVALGVLEDRGGFHMTLKYWIKIGLLGSLIPMAIGTLALIIIFT
jgi:Na+/H+ antiporter NhaD/arsenite permease-like protein